LAIEYQLNVRELRCAGLSSARGRFVEDFAEMNTGTQQCLIGSVFRDPALFQHEYVV
jgi:hypothetical protein